MPAPTALVRAPEALAENVDATMNDAAAVPLPEDDAFDASLLDMTAASSSSAVAVQPPNTLEELSEDTPITDESGRPRFPPTNSIPLAFKREQRKVPVPPHRYSPLKNAWPKMYPPLVEHLKLQVRMNTHSKSVELRTSSKTTDTGALQKGEDFVKAFCLGFEVDDAIALLRLDDLYIEENASRTRVVLADSKIHILGGFKNIHIAREAIVSLILGAQPGKVYGNLRTVAGRMKERF
ncbi:pre-rRNA-processing protein pno1 [Kalmusia sp. IMI 367209]|nr:pre-rRNA-processing protein pno1 [Kalmusia sp. IMI 367209]